MHREGATVLQRASILIVKFNKQSMFWVYGSGNLSQMESLCMMGRRSLPSVGSTIGIKPEFVEWGGFDAEWEHA